MGNKLYLECGSGISGDMFVGAMLDLGADQKKLEEALQSLSVDGFKTEITRVKKSGLDACDFNVILDHAHENHDHDMEYLHGDHHDDHHHGEHHHDDHDHGDHHHEDHNHDNHHHEEHHHHEHRSPEDMIHIIGHASMTDSARELACKIVKILANAEAKAHGVPIEQVHFHEVGAVDSIVDIVAAAVCADSLNFDEVYIPQLNEGRGMVRCQHGLLPIPVPAVANIITDHHLKLHITNIDGELVTPTGAAIAAALRTSEQLPEQFVIEKVGMGAGKREYECVGVLRAMMIV